MAKGVGLDAGAFEVKLVELDGSYRRPKLTKLSIERVASHGGETPEERAANTAEAAAQAVKDGGISRDGVIYGFPCRGAVLRNLSIPFVGDDAIRKVIKFEAEGSIHSHSVDEMVIDFMTLERLDDETRVLIAAVPKPDLGLDLEALDKAGIDPEHVDLDTMALYRVAEWSGCFGEEIAEAAASQAESDGSDDLEDALPVTLGSVVPGQGARARVVIDVGARSTRLLAVVGGKLVDMRALRIGEEGMIADLATRTGEDPEVVRRAVSGEPLVDGEHAAARDVGGEFDAEADFDGDQEFDETQDAEFVLDEGGEDFDQPPAGDVDIADATFGGGGTAGPDTASDAEGAGGEVVAADAERPTEPLTDELVEAARQRFLGRLRRELLRFLTSLPKISGVEQVHLTGGGSDLQGVPEVIADVFECPVAHLDVLERLNHNLDDDEAHEVGPRIAVAVGLALSALGRRDGFDFRQEELAFRRRFDRIKFPLAIACMLLTFLPFLYAVRQQKELTFLEKRYGLLHEVSQNQTTSRSRSAGPATEAVFWGFTGALMTRNGVQGSVLYRCLGREEYEKLTRELIADGTDTFSRLSIIRRRLDKHLKREQEKTGVYQDLQLPSGYYVLAYLVDHIAKYETQLGSFVVSELQLDLSTASNRYAQLKITVRGPNFRTRYETLRSSLSDTFSDPSSPFAEFGKAQAEKPWQDGTEEGCLFDLRLNLKDRWDTELGQ